MYMKPGTKVYVAPEDLTGDDGFRDIGTVLSMAAPSQPGCYVVRCDECDEGETYVVKGEQLTPMRKV